MSRLPEYQTFAHSLVGEILGDRYRVLEKIGSGGMGVVFRVEHTKLEKQFALKTLYSNYIENQELVQRFEREAKATSKIGHENIVEILDFGEDPKAGYFFVMEYLQGKSLNLLLKRMGALSISRSCYIALQIAEALAVAHQMGIVHRDLKPENIILLQGGNTPDRVKLLDFGLAAIIEENEKKERISKTGAVYGTPTYMSPEQIKGLSINQSVDIYSMGIILYEMLTGTVPFRGPSAYTVLHQHCSVPPPRLRDAKGKREAIPTTLEHLVHRCLEKTPQRRFQSMQDLMGELRKHISVNGFSQDPYWKQFDRGLIQFACQSVTKDHLEAPPPIPRNVSLSQSKLHLKAPIPWRKTGSQEKDGQAEPTAPFHERDLDSDVSSSFSGEISHDPFSSWTAEQDSSSAMPATAIERPRSARSPDIATSPIDCSMPADEESEQHTRMEKPLSLRGSGIPREKSIDDEHHADINSYDQLQQVPDNGQVSEQATRLDDNFFGKHGSAIIEDRSSPYDFESLNRMPLDEGALPHDSDDLATRMDSDLLANLPNQNLGDEEEADLSQLISDELDNLPPTRVEDLALTQLSALQAAGTPSRENTKPEVGVNTVPSKKPEPFGSNVPSDKIELSGTYARDASALKSNGNATEEFRQTDQYGAPGSIHSPLTGISGDGANPATSPWQSVLIFSLIVLALALVFLLISYLT